MPPSPVEPDHSWGVPTLEVLTLVRAYLEDAATRTHARLGGVAGVGITSAVAGEDPVTAGASTTLVEEVDRLQYALGRGPCLDALREGRGAYVPDLAAETRWGPYGPEAAARGARSCLSVPVTDGRSRVLGVVKVYSDRVDGLDEHQRRVGRELALEVAGGVGLATTLVATSLELDDRIEAMDTRRTIDLATGLLMGRLGCGPEAAFGLLRRESQNRNVKVQEVAADLVAQAPAPADGAAQAVSRAPFHKRGEAPARGR